MKKAIFLSTLIFAFVFSTAALAKVDRVQGGWNLEGEHAVSFTCGGGEYNHTMNVDEQDKDGNFSGTGYYDANNSYTWDVTGQINGDDISFTVVYTGANAGYTLNADGTIAADGSIGGTVDNNCQTFAMPEGTAAKEAYKNHGQYVKSQDNKQEAAQSRVGMPEQSKGHTK